MFKYTAIVSDCDTYHLSANYGRDGEFYGVSLDFYFEGSCETSWDNDEYLLSEVYPYLKKERTDKELDELFPTKEVEKELLEMFEEAIKLGMFKNTKIYETK